MRTWFSALILAVLAGYFFGVPVVDSVLSVGFFVIATAFLLVGIGILVGEKRLPEQVCRNVSEATELCKRYRNGLASWEDIEKLEKLGYIKIGIGYDRERAVVFVPQVISPMQDR